MNGYNSNLSESMRHYESDLKVAYEYVKGQ